MRITGSSEGRPVYKCGKLRGQAYSLDSLLKKVYKYESNAKSVAQTNKGTVISTAISAVLLEASTASAAVMFSPDPTRMLLVPLVQPGSGGEMGLNDAIAELPQNSSVVNALLKAVCPAQARLLGLTTATDVPGLGAAAPPLAARTRVVSHP